MALINYRSRFLIKNLLKGLFGLAVIVVAYVLLQKFTDFDFFLEKFGDLPILVYSIFTLSEVVFGIIPPELFMIWSIKHGIFESYALDVSVLTIISLIAGIIGYYVGTKIETIAFLETFFNQYISKYKNLLNRYAGFLIIVGAVTPVPFSAICMLVGATNYPFPKFLLMTTSRILRFAVYSFVIYQANI